jgi:hypothetical protein
MVDSYSSTTESKRPRIGPQLGPRTGRRIGPLTRLRIGPQEGTFARTSDGHLGWDLGWDLGFGPR